MTRRGLFVPPFDVLADPGLVAELAALAEEAGWDGFFVWDHLLYAAPVTAIADPWICCAAIAVRTSRILFGPMVTPLSRRRPQVVARQAVSLERLSGGRLVLGFGLGDDGPEGELSRFGEETDARARAALLDDGLALLGELLSGETVEHAGGRGARFLPAPAARIPIWIAGRWPNAAPLRRAARYDGAFVISVPDAAGLRELRARLAALRDDDPGRFDVVVDIPAGQDPAPWAEAGADWVLTRVGPYELDLDAVRAVIRSGP